MSQTLKLEAAAGSTKMVIVGAGSVGTTTAYALLLSGLAADIVLIDINQARVEGEVADLGHAAHFTHTRVRSGTYADCAGATAVIITAGANQKPGQTRPQLVAANHALFASIIPPIAAASSPDTILVVATNPADVLTHAAVRLSGFPPYRVIGTGTALDTTRLRRELGAHFGISPRSVHAFVVGEHGDSQLPAWSLANICGMRLPEYCRQAGRAHDEAEMEACAKRTRDAAYTIIERKGKTNYGIASVIVAILEPIVKNADAIMTVSQVGTYAGVEDVALSMPCKINRRGAFQEVPLPLDERETELLRRSAESIRAMIMSVAAPE
ncbi:L-lactate dehydrogenase [Sodiomyces alkalinus F11]|uniref:L-lactate dehydrogenase n=1 Tax=Sodiomyces alkalinus (strain CBS 110278 / VKM F-3762 / F11) TaxID=1314773 RepID=A0A3N2QAW3_SODAK|nr:L-lactate dehydrogenase [Sodiomyces alkalinus F11]ROT43837.1 L-lactate dehydrogenase [Sodiomyces alkalinus F11]